MYFLTLKTKNLNKNANIQGNKSLKTAENLYCASFSLETLSTIFSQNISEHLKHKLCEAVVLLKTL